MSVNVILIKILSQYAVLVAENSLRSGIRADHLRKFLYHDNILYVDSHCGSSEGRPVKTTVVYSRAC